MSRPTSNRGRLPRSARNVSVSWALALCLAALPACSADVADGGGTTAAGPTVTGTLSTTVDGTQVDIDYAGGKVVAEIVHKLNPEATGYGCITSLYLSLSKADGSCPLELTFQPGAGDGLALSEASFFAAKAATPCEGFPGSDKGVKVEWTLAGGDASVLIAPVQPGEANKTSATLKAQDLKPKGTIKLKNGGKQFELDLSSFRIKGDLKSTGSTQVSCGTAIGEEICPKGVTYGNKVGDYVRQPLGAYRCDDDSPYNPAELCGSPAQLIVAYQHWVTENDNWGGKDVITALATTIANYKDIGVVFVVLTGKQKVVVKNAEGKFEASGPAPTKADCDAIKAEYKLPDSVVMVYDKDKSLTSTDKQPVGAGFTPAIAAASSEGKIVAVLPDSEGKMDQGKLDAAIQQAIDTN